MAHDVVEPDYKVRAEQAEAELTECREAYAEAKKEIGRLQVKIAGDHDELERLRVKLYTMYDKAGAELSVGEAGLVRGFLEPIISLLGDKD